MGDGEGSVEEEGEEVEQEEGEDQMALSQVGCISLSEFADITSCEGFSWAQTQVALNALVVWPQNRQMCMPVRGRGTVCHVRGHGTHGQYFVSPWGCVRLQSSPEHMTQAIRLVEEEVLLDDQAIFQAVRLLKCNPSLATAYLDFGRQGLRSKWLEQELAVDSAAAASQLSLPMYPME